jgi:WD40 repeat protein
MHYLASHAAAGGSLERLLGEPDFLLNMLPEALVPHLAMMRRGTSRAIARAYRKASGSLRGKEEPDRRAYLSTALLQEGAGDTFRKLRETATSWLWMPLWTRWTPASPSYDLFKGNSPISALETAEWGPGQTAALIGRVDSSVEVWDFESGNQLASWRPGDLKSTRSVSLFSTTDGRLLITSWMNGDLGVINLENGLEAWYRPESERGGVTALCATHCYGRPVCIVALRNLTLRMYALPSLTIILERSNATAAAIYVLKLVKIGEDHLLLSGGESMESRQHLEHSLLRIWSFPDLEPLWGDNRKERGCIRHFDVGNIAGQMLLISSQDGWRPLAIWNLVDREFLYEAKSPANQGWFIELQNEKLLIRQFGAQLGEYVSLDRICGVPSPDFRLETIRDKIPIEGESFSVVQLHGRPTLLSSILDHVSVWDLAELLAAEPSETAAGSASIMAVKALTNGQDSEETLFVGSRTGEVIALRGDTGSEEWRLELGENINIVALSYLPRTEQSLLVAADSNGAVHVIDVETQREMLPPINVGQEILALTTSEWRGQALAFMTVEHLQRSRVWAARVWNLENGKEVTGEKSKHGIFRWSLSFGEEDKAMYGLAIAKLEPSIRIAFASKYGKVMVSNFGEADPRGGRKFEEWWIPDSDGGYTRSLAVGRTADTWLLAAGTEDGKLVVWNFQTGVMNAQYSGAHFESINVLFFIEQGKILVSGGKDGRIKFWSAGLRALFDINVGEAITSATWLHSNRLAVGTNRGVLMFDVNSQRMATMTSPLR